MRATDAGGLTYEEAFTITINGINESPTDIGLTKSNVSENMPAGTYVGTLFAIDPDAGDSHTFALVAGAGDSGNASFQIVGNDLQTAAMFDRETQSSYTIRVRATDSLGLSYEEQLTIAVSNVNEPPVFDDFDPVAPGVQKTISFRIGPDRAPEGDNNVIFDLNAHDPDLDVLTYSIANQNSDNLFAVDAATGRITLVNWLSQATAPVQVINVVVQDPGGLSDNGQLMLTIEHTSVGITGDTQAVEGTADQIRLRFVRKGTDMSGALTVQFAVSWSNGVSPALSTSDFSVGTGLTTLQAGSIVIPAGATEATLDLDAIQETPPLGVGEVDPDCWTGWGCV